MRSPLFRNVVAAADERGAPLAIGIEFHAIVARSEYDGARRCVGDRDRVGEDALHALIGRKWLAFLDADCGEHSDDLRVKGIGRLVLDHGVDLFVEMEIVGVDRVELHAR